MLESEDDASMSTSYAEAASLPPPASNNTRKRARATQDYDGSSDGSSPISPSNANVNTNGRGRGSSGLRKVRSGSSISFDGRAGPRGISVGAARAVSGVVKGIETVGKITGAGSDEGAGNGGNRRR